MKWYHPKRIRILVFLLGSLARLAGFRCYLLAMAKANSSDRLDQRGPKESPAAALELSQ